MGLFAQTDCQKCPMYWVHNEVMEAFCRQLPGRRMEVDTAPPYDRVITPPEDCPLNKKTRGGK